MTRKRKTKKEKELLIKKNRASYLKSETKKAALGILFTALGIFFILAELGGGGLAGEYIGMIFGQLFGNGSLLLPILLLLFAIYLFRSLEINLAATRVVGGIILFLSGLGLIEIIVGKNHGGLLGRTLSTPLIKYFDFYASVIFLGALAVISIVVAFDSHEVLGFGLWRRLFGWNNKKEDEEKEEDVKLSRESEALLAQVENNDKPAEQTKKDGLAKKDEMKINDSSEKDMLGGLPFFNRKTKTGSFVPPPVSLLESDSGKPNAGDIKANANIIKRTLSNFGISVEMDEVSIGPTVTRYALKPAEGMKLSRIVALQNDLALSLAAHPLRIEAQIPGKSLVGIEIPNKQKAIIRLASLLSTVEYTDSHHPLFIALGRDISGVPRYGNLAKAPHLLIAGATGSGKSVTIYTVITSLLYRNPPERLRLIMIDPKRVELTLYNKIPHLLTSVITNSKKAISVLRWLAKEMDRRYDVLEAETVRDIQSYHKNVVEPALVKRKTENDSEDNEEDEIERMPYIVVIIDELADIMTAYPRELEAAIVRLAQMSRAVGIHLILSTQRPSVEIITGLIKANIPSRIALQVASQIDSRTILDMAGAEKLLGAGDMLYISGEMSKPVRLQSAYICEEEVKKVADYLAKQYADNLPNELDLSDSISSDEKSTLNVDFGGDDADDDLYEDARQAVMEAGKASASYLQRKLKVGYARAARLLDMLEERGVIGPGDGAKPREVYGAPVNNEKEIMENETI